MTYGFVLRSEARAALGRLRDSDPDGVRLVAAAMRALADTRGPAAYPDPSGHGVAHPAGVWAGDARGQSSGGSGLSLETRVTGPVFGVDRHPVPPRTLYRVLRCRMHTLTMPSVGFTGNGITLPLCCTFAALSAFVRRDDQAARDPRCTAGSGSPQPTARPSTSSVSWWNDAC